MPHPGCWASLHHTPCVNGCSMRGWSWRLASRHVWEVGGTCDVVISLSNHGYGCGISNHKSYYYFCFIMSLLLGSRMRKWGSTRVARHHEFGMWQCGSVSWDCRWLLLVTPWLLSLQQVSDQQLDDPVVVLVDVTSAWQVHDRDPKDKVRDACVALGHLKPGMCGLFLMFPWVSLHSLCKQPSVRRGVTPSTATTNLDRKLGNPERLKQISSTTSWKGASMVSYLFGGSRLYPCARPAAKVVPGGETIERKPIHHHGWGLKPEGLAVGCSVAIIARPSIEDPTYGPPKCIDLGLTKGYLYWIFCSRIIRGDGFVGKTLCCLLDWLRGWQDKTYTWLWWCASRLWKAEGVLMVEMISPKVLESLKNFSPTCSIPIIRTLFQRTVVWWLLGVGNLLTGDMPCYLTRCGSLSPWASTGVGSSDLFLGWLGKGPWMTWGCMVGRVVGTSHGFKSK